MFRNFLLSLIVFVIARATVGAEQIVTPQLHALRLGPAAEWSDAPRQAEGPRLALDFQAKNNTSEQTLRLRQQDVRQTWKVLLNGKELGRLTADENDMVVYFAIPPQALRDGSNRLAIEQVGKVNDDIRVGEMVLLPHPLKEALAEATVEITVVDDAMTPLPCRLTIVNADGALATVGAKSNEQLAVRPGVVYAGRGMARVGAPAGRYTVYAGRGFEYGIASVNLDLRPGDKVDRRLVLRREVATPGYVVCDPHVHTVTFSGHGDCTLEERMLTLAGEAVELPVATDHNRQIDYQEAAEKLGMRRYFTPIVGNEVTTAWGHFNIFPAPAGGPLPDHKLSDWTALQRDISAKTRAQAIILNHARDVHSGFRPFGPQRHVGLTGESLDDRILPANAMEIINSGAQQTDVLQLTRDWLGLLNRGVFLTPVGSSDSHDVSRYIVGQGRTYIRCDDRDPGKIDVAAAVDNFVAGRVLVSCGLLAEITVNKKHGPGDLVPADGAVMVSVRVQGPSWVQADRIELYANGVKVREAEIAKSDRGGVKWEGRWTLPRPMHDVHLVAVATGPGVTAPYWPIARPYQATAPVVQSRVLGVTGAVWVDGDGDGRRTPASHYARQVVEKNWPALPRVIGGLAAYDEAVAQQAASELRRRGASLQNPEVAELAKKAGLQVVRAFHDYAAAWRASAIAQTEAPAK